MIKLSLNQLEEAVRNPIAFRNKFAGADGGKVFYGASYYTELRNAVFKFHSSGNSVSDGEEYLVARLGLEKYKSDSHKKEMMDQYSWYVTDVIKSDIHVFGWRYSVSIRHTTGITVDLEVGGEIGRLDLVPAGGYAAWLFRKNGPENWENELRMRLIQHELSIRLNAKQDEISVGIYSFDERVKEQTCFSNQEITDAETAFNKFATEYLAG